MAILVDYSQVALAIVFVATNNDMGLDENILRHMLLNSIKHLRNKFKNDYGEIVLCVDGKHSWRKTVYPYYKASRRKAREESPLDWGEIFRIIALIKEEIDDYFPYKVMHFDNCEADDVIGSISQKYGTPLDMGTEKFLIVSTDKDFIQLHRFANVRQYNPVKKEFIEFSNPEAYLVEHVIRGDKGDGIPNILSDDSCIVLGERQKTISSKKLELFSGGVDNMDDETKNRYYRNKTLIDLSEIPEHLQAMIIDKYEMDKQPAKGRLFNYFMDKKLKNLMQDIQDFK